MADRVRVGLRVPSTPAATDLDGLRRFVVEAERLGFDSLWVGDHLFHPVDVYHPMLLMTWMAALTSRVRFGTAIMLTAYRDPVFLAKEAATLDRLSGGRLCLGVSLGGVPREYEALDVPMKQRAIRLERNIEVMRELWAGDRLNPRPVQPRLPILMGGAHDRALRRAARLCDGWIGTSGAPPADFAPKVSQVMAYASELGRDPRSLEFGKLLSVSIGSDRPDAIKRAEAHLGPYYGGRFDIERDAVCGTAQEVADGVRAFNEVDCSKLTMILEPSSLDLGLLMTLASAVLKLQT